jgi:hypothetical protein
MKLRETQIHNSALCPWELATHFCPESVHPVHIVNLICLRLTLKYLGVHFNVRRSFQLVCPSARPCVAFCNMQILHPPDTLEDGSFSPAQSILLNTLTVSIQSGGCLNQPQPYELPFSDKGSHPLTVCEIRTLFQLETDVSWSQPPDSRYLLSLPAKSTTPGKSEFRVARMLPHSRSQCQ